MTGLTLRSLCPGIEFPPRQSLNTRLREYRNLSGPAGDERNLFLSTTNNIQRHKVLFIVVSALHVSSGFSAHHQELKNCTCSIGYLSDLSAATANVGESERLTHVLHVQFLSS